jgi:hypothetical protein
LGLTLLLSRQPVWLDVIGLAIAVTLLEAALAGRGRTIAHGRTSFWHVAPWLRPILSIIGFGLLGLVVVSFFARF